MRAHSTNSATKICDQAISVTLIFPTTVSASDHGHCIFIGLLIAKTWTVNVENMFCLFCSNHCYYRQNSFCTFGVHVFAINNHMVASFGMFRQRPSSGKKPMSLKVVSFHIAVAELVA